MKFKLLKILLLLIFLVFFQNISFAALKNSIVAKVGNEIITSLDIQNEIKTILILGNKNINQKNINDTKAIALKSLIRDSIKKIEVEKFNVKEFNQKAFDNYLLNVSKNLNTNKSDLKNYFEKNNISYKKFVKKIQTELMWNSLIFKIYRNQLNINPVEVENEIKQTINKKNNIIEYKLSEIEIPITKDIQKIINQVYDSIDKEGFKNAAKKFSVSTSSINNGEIGWIFENTLSKNYLNELKKIKEGGVSRPIKIVDSVVILKIDNIKTTANVNINLNKIKDRIINQKKEEKLKLFSRSHFSNLENSILIEFQ